jgi:hypothetical protein
MREQTAFEEATKKWKLKNFEISPEERAILRGLAIRIADAAARPEQQEKAALWKQHNQLQPTRPLIFCDPENGWNEIIVDADIKCTNELAAAWENRLRKELFWAEQMGDDKVIDNNFYVYYAYQDTGWGADAIRVKTAEEGSYTWLPGLKSYDMLDSLHYPEITVDYDATNLLFEKAKELFDGILNVEIRGQWWWSLNPANEVVYMRGLEQMMMDMYDYPNELHRLMAFLRDGMLQKLDFLQTNGLLSRNDGNIYVGSGGFGFTDELPSPDFSGHIRTCDMWGFSECQETTCISPAMFEEFAFVYQLPLMEPFGLTCYGCCEPMEKRWEIVKRARNLRRVSVSPWANVAEMRELLGSDYVFSYKPNPAYIAQPDNDWELVRSQLREIIALTRNCRVEIIMKDNHTIGENPGNVKQWCRIAREESDRL